MGTPGGSEPRAHHFVPQCWLAGFTDSGEKDGRLWTTDLKRQKQWQGIPANTGHRRDFYRIDVPGMDPTAFEKNYGEYESAIAPTLKLLNEEKREPGREELEDLLTFMAIQWTRVPTFRPTVLGITDSFMRGEVETSLASPESWEAALATAGIPTDSPGSEYEKMREFQQSGEYKLTAETEWYLVEAFKAAKVIVPQLRARYWRTMISPSGSFIGSDNPVILDGALKGEMVGFKNAEVVVYPISRWQMLCGTKDLHQHPRMTRKNIAFLNTLTMLAADEQIYSAAQNFCWMDENRQYQTDWTLFDREKLLSRSG